MSNQSGSLEPEVEDDSLLKEEQKNHSVERHIY